MEEKEYLTEAEACTYLGISRGTLYNYVKRDLLRKYTQKAQGRYSTRNPNWVLSRLSNPGND